MEPIYDGWILPFYDRLESISNLSSGDIAVWYALLSIAIGAGGASREFSATIKTIEFKSRLSRSSVHESINRLQQASLITYKRGSGRNAPRFSLCPCGGHYAGRYAGHYAGRYAGRYAGHLDDIYDDDEEKNSKRAREAWRVAFGEKPTGVLGEEVTSLSREWSADLLREAFNAAALAGAANKMGYVRSTLNDWRGNGIDTIEKWAEAQYRYDLNRSGIGERRPT